MVLSALEDDGEVYIGEENYARIATVILYYIIHMAELCVSNAASSSSSLSTAPPADFSFYVLALANLHPEQEDPHLLSATEVRSILQVINQNYQPASPHTQVGHASLHSYTSMLWLAPGPQTATRREACVPINCKSRGFYLNYRGLDPRIQ